MNALPRAAATFALLWVCAAAIVWACGPDYTPLPTVFSLEPADHAAFARGLLASCAPASAAPRSPEPIAS